MTRKPKSPNVLNVLGAINLIQSEMEAMNKAERQELGRYLNLMADAFTANAPDETVVPGIKEVTMSISDVARCLIDTYNLV